MIDRDPEHFITSLMAQKATLQELHYVTKDANGSNDLVPHHETLSGLQDFGRLQMLNIDGLSPYLDYILASEFTTPPNLRSLSVRLDCQSRETDGMLSSTTIIWTQRYRRNYLG